MERTKYLLSIVAAISLSASISNASAQSTSSQQIYKAYVSGDIDQWTRVIDSLENALKPGTEAQQLELLNYYYGHIGYLIGIGQKSVAKSYLAKGEQRIDNLLTSNPSQASLLAYKGIFIAYSMSMNKIAVPILGPQSMKYIKKAYQSDPANVDAIAAMGNMLFHAPGIFGGSKAEGISYLKTAIERMEQSGSTDENWNYLNLMVMYAQYLDQSGNPKAALAQYEKILAAEPDFVWVRDELYPALKSKSS